jgi:hypothetical protein
MKRLAALFVFVLPAVFVHAQQFSAFPPSVKWQQINTDTARIIFPGAVDSQAQDIAAIIHKIMMLRPNSLGNNVRKVNIVLHNNTTLANGYVALAPFRSEYYLVPGSDIFEFGANPWYKELAVHEYRHVLQYINFNRGISKAASIILGQGGQALFNAMAIPDWFWEGDAVHSETSLTTQGRGRTSYFFNGYKSLWRERRNYSWMKLRNGSLKDYVPDHYNLGYLLVNYGYLKYGNDFWRKVTEDAAAFRGIVYPFQQAIKRYSGVNYKTFRQQALNYYSHEVSRKRTDVVKRETVSNYYFPQCIGNDSLLYLKKSYNSLPAFFLQDKRGEHRLRLMNISTEEWFSYSNGIIAYTGYETNARWSLIDYSSIYLYNIKTGEQTKITSKAKYYTPDISPSGKKIIAVFVDAATKTSLHVLDVSGKILQTIQPPNRTNFAHPRFIDDNTIVVTERLPNATMQMSRIDLLNGSREILIPSTSALLGYPFYSNGSVYFVSSVAGMDDIYALQLSDKKVFQLASGTTGKYYPSVYKDRLLWSAFTSNGLKIQKEILNTSSNEVDASIWKEVVLPYPVASADIPPSTTIVNASRRFPVTRYRQGAHLFNFHSWQPNYTDPEFTLSLFSNNILNTFSNELYYRYNQNETSHAFGFVSSYGALFPIINAGLEYNIGRSIATRTRSYELNQFEGKIGLNVPLNFTAGRTYKFFNAGSNIVYNRTMSTLQSKDSFERTIQYLSHFIRWSHYLPEARQHIYPKFGYTFSGDLRHLIDTKGWGFKRSSQWLSGAQLFLPSVKNHSIVLSAAYQRIDTNSVIFSNRFSISRGYEDYYYKKMWRVSGNYHFPIAYPDFGVANIIYFQRVRGNIFYDHTVADTSYFSGRPLNMNLRSTGAEIFFDTKLWNELPVSFGIRGSYLLNNGRSANDRRGNVWFELVLPASLIPE